MLVRLVNEEMALMRLVNNMTFLSQNRKYPLYVGIPSGKRLHNYGKSPFLMGKSTISMAIFNSSISLPEGMFGYEFLIHMGTV